MQIRRARENEVSQLSALAFESKASWGYSAAQMDEWREQLTVSRAAVVSRPSYVAELETAVAGFYVLAPAKPFWELDHFWVSPRHMGIGVGRALLAHAATRVAAGGANALAIDADPNAEPFYLACGAKRVGTLAAPIAGSPDRVRPQLLLAARKPSGRSTAERTSREVRG